MRTLSCERENFIKSPVERNSEAEPSIHIENFMDALALIATAGARESATVSVAESMVSAARLLGALSAYVYVPAEGAMALEMAAFHNLPPDLALRLAWVPLDAPLLATRAARTGKVQLVASPEKLPADALVASQILQHAEGKAMAAVPLIADKRLEGVLTLIFKFQPLLFSKPSMLDALAHIGAFALASSRSRSREQLFRRQLDVVRTAADSIGTPLDLKTVLRNLVDEARVLARAQYAAIGIAQTGNENGPFQPWVYSGMTDEQVAQIGPTPRPVGLLGAVPNEGKTIRVSNLNDDPRFHGFPKHHPPMTSFLGVPIRYHGRPIGNLYLTNKIGAAQFSAEDQRTIEMLAEQIAIAIDHSQSHERILQELAERRLAEAEREVLLGELDAERRWLGAVVDGSRSFIIMIQGADGARVVPNQRVKEEIEREIVPERGLKQLEGLLCDKEGVPLASSEMPAWLALKGQTVTSQECIFRGKSAIPVLVSAAPIRDDAGNIIGAMVTAEDIRVLKDLERLREEWTSIVAHDLRQPVTVINGYAELLVGDLTDAATKKKAENILRSGKSLSRMIHDLLDLSALEAKGLRLERQMLDPSKLVQLVVDHLAPTLGEHPVRIYSEEHIPLISADPQRMEQVMSNLLSNAAKYSTPGSELTISISGEHDVEIAVQNQGGGIPEPELREIFQRFYRVQPSTRTEPGLGLGLYISKELVEAHGGRIWAESTPGDRTTFHVCLPAAV